MGLKEIMVSEVSNVLEETTNFVTNRLVMESLLRNGKVTIEEANFFHSLSKDVITEAAEDFIPDTVTTRYAGEIQESARFSRPQELTESEVIVNKLINKMV
jgi:hypothetical protein